MRASDPIERMFADTPPAELPRGIESHQHFCFADPAHFRVDIGQRRILYTDGPTYTTFSFATRATFVAALERFTDALATVAGEQAAFTHDAEVTDAED